jgi:hypothetical protein
MELHSSGKLFKSMLDGMLIDGAQASFLGLGLERIFDMLQSCGPGVPHEMLHKNLLLSETKIQWSSV